MNTYTRKFMQYFVEVSVDETGTECWITDTNFNACSSLAAAQCTGTIADDTHGRDIPISDYALDLIETWAIMVGY